MEFKNITKELLYLVSDTPFSINSETPIAYNIREDCQSIARASTEHIKIESKKDGPGLEIYISSETKGEKVFIPACVTKSNIDDLVYNDFFIAEGADVIIVAGCGLHSETDELARHNGIHRFFCGKNSHVLYVEKHVGTGKDTANRVINPVTDAILEEGAYLEMDTSQLGGITDTTRTCKVKMNGADSRLVIKERLLTNYDETAKTSFAVEVNGENASVNLISRSVARGDSVQEYQSDIIGNVVCQGHSECDGILAENGKVTARPCLIANSKEAALIHEAAIGKIAGEQLLKLRSLGLSEAEAEETIINGFLK